LVINGTETSVGTGSGLLRQQNIHVLVFGDLVGSLVDPLAAELVFLPETVVGLATQGNNSISSVLFFEEPGCPLVVGSMFGGVITGKPVVLL
jgi:hypothetical protein